MKKWIIISLLAGSLFACGRNESTQEIRDNETPVAAPDVVNDREDKPDTTATLADTTGIR